MRALPTYLPNTRTVLGGVYGGVTGLMMDGNVGSREPEKEKHGCGYAAVEDEEAHLAPSSAVPMTRTPANMGHP